MIFPETDTQIWIACGVTDMRRGMDSLAAQVQQQLHVNPYCGHLFVFRSRAGDRIKILWSDQDGMCLFLKRLEEGHFVWPQAVDGKVHLTRAQLSMLLEGIDWRHPKRTKRPTVAA
jgi:transposase